MNKVYLLDADVLIALANPDHIHHARADSWFNPNVQFATCPITQGSLMRYYMRYVQRASIAAAKHVLAGFIALPNHQFWPDDAAYTEIPEKGVMGHRQVTDAYLVALAAKHKGAVATMDEALAAIHSGVLLLPRHS